ncbi:MAG: phosphatase PAP2 family protein [Gemmatimonadales bacterium]
MREAYPSRWLALAMLALGAGTATAQDSSAVRAAPSLRATLLPLAGLVVGVAIADDGVRDLAQNTRGGLGNGVASVGNRFGEPAVVFPILGATFLVGKLAGDSRLAGVSFRAGRAAALAGVATQVLKFGLGRERPFVGDHDEDRFHPLSGKDVHHSFPSGHTAIAFALAGSFASETSNPWLRASLYGAAGLTGFARINNDKHWLSDVVAGAAFGVLTAKLLDSRRISVVATPGGIGVTRRF